jgi:hypothetical protein
LLMQNKRQGRRACWPDRCIVPSYEIRSQTV